MPLNCHFVSRFLTKSWEHDKPFISVIDLKARTMIGRIPAPNGTQGIAASPDGKLVVAMDFAEPVMIVIDPRTDQVIDRIPLKDQTNGGYKVCGEPRVVNVLRAGTGIETLACY